MFFRKKGGNVVSVANGKAVDLSTVSDPAFASKAMGEGVAIIPSDGKVVAPINGEITMIFPTNHAFGIKGKDGVEFLIHIGIDTVNLNGNGFSAIASAGQKVKAGDSIIDVDLGILSSNNVDSTIMFIVTDDNGKAIKTTVNQEVVAGQTEVISY
ncbi:MAG: hypothetical protein ATN36_00720 [Epulopiscium sp. Nele67-Bin005]|nr:MAG: hypothetical protein ATN36_00720 [Epulopiscium sp. Nele67-Bin005]